MSVALLAADKETLATKIEEKLCAPWPGTNLFLLLKV